MNIIIMRTTKREAENIAYYAAGIVGTVRPASSEAEPVRGLYSVMARQELLADIQTLADARGVRTAILAPQDTIGQLREIKKALA